MGFVRDTCETLASAIIIKTLITNWLSDYIETGLKKLFVHTKRQLVIWTHTIEHKQKTPAHTGKLFICRDSPCDTLHISDQDLGLPSGNLPVSK